MHNTYLVRLPNMAPVDEFQAVSPSQAACKAYNSLRRKNGNDVTINNKFIVESKFHKSLKYYSVECVNIESPSLHEIKHKIKIKTIAKKQEPFLSVE